MNYPFTTEQFIGVIARYNNAIWPMQIVFYLLALVIIFLIFRQHKYSSKIISVILGGLWLWMGIVYHWIFFTNINPAAKLFGTVFILQGLLFLFYGVIKNKLEFKFNNNIRAYIGLAFITTGLVIYPIIGYVLGHRFPDNPTFGLPCPTTIFTFGMLLLGIIPKRLIIIPFLWSIVGFMAAISFGIKEDVLLLLSGIIALIIILFFKQKASLVLGSDI